MTRLAMLGLGYAFLGLGILGLVLPFLQGFLFIFIGLILLSRHAAWARRALDWTRARFPQLAGLIDKAEQLSERWVQAALDRARRLRDGLSRGRG
jgi:uncharacterized protein YqgC (DUF456 family)